MNEQQPLRVLHVIGSMDMGGSETMIMNLYRHIDREKVQFDFVEGVDRESYFDEEIRTLGGRIFNCPTFKGFNICEYVKWWESFLDAHHGEFGIVHGHIGSTASIYLKLARSRGIFTIAHSHNTKGNISLKNLTYRLLSYSTRFIADEFFACSEAAGKDRFGKAITASDRFYLLKNAIDTGIFSFDEKVRERVRSTLFVDDRYVIGHIGAFRKEKNHSFLLEIFAAIKKENSKAILLLAGDGLLRGQVKEKAQMLDITDDVLFLGVRKDVCDLAQAMDVLVMPSIYEGLPLTLIEAQTSGLPCVISDKIPDESIIIEDIVEVMRLDEEPKEWAAKALSMSRHKRQNRCKEMIDAGYDINTTGAWLEKYYLEHAKG